MASLIMHIVASKIIGDKYNLSDRFVAGSGMPDIYAKCNIERDKTHFTETQNLPGYQMFLKTYEDRLDDEIVLGYAAHLIEDDVWVKYFRNKYIRKISSEPPEVEYIKDGSIHPKKEYFQEIYKDYDNIDSYLCNKYSILLGGVKNSISKYYTKFGSREKLKEVLFLHEFDVNRENVFITQEDANEFIEISKQEVDKYLKQYLLEVNAKDFSMT